MKIDQNGLDKNCEISVTWDQGFWCSTFQGPILADLLYALWPSSWWWPWFRGFWYSGSRHSVSPPLAIHQNLHEMYILESGSLECLAFKDVGIVLSFLYVYSWFHSAWLMVSIDTLTVLTCLSRSNPSQSALLSYLPADGNLSGPFVAFKGNYVIFWCIEPSLNTQRAVSWSAAHLQGLWSTFIMISPPQLPVALLLQVALCLAAATNISIDDQDPLFHYYGSWQRITTNLNSAGVNLDMDGGHMLTYTAGSSATITYTCAYFFQINPVIGSSQRFSSHISFFLFLFLLDSEIDRLNERLTTVASVYFLSTLWPYSVSTDYAIDGNTPITIDMQDHSAPATSGGNATVASGVVGQWTSSVNQEHTILVTIPPGGTYAVVDMFM